MSGQHYFLTILLITVVVLAVLGNKLVNQWRSERQQDQEKDKAETEIRLENGRIQLEALRKQTELATTASEASDAARRARDAKAEENDRRRSY